MDLMWLLGFIEGEGCFSIGLVKSKSSKLGYRVQPTFVIKLTLSEEDVIKEIRHFLEGIGNVYHESSKTNRNKGMKNANDCVSIRVTKLSDLKKIIKIFDGLHFVSNAKREDYEVWTECIEMIEKREHTTKEGLLKIADMRDHIHKRKQWNKKNYCEFRKEIDPCKVYIKTKKIPEYCEECRTYILG